LVLMTEYRILNAPIPAGAEVIDLSSYAGIPGLIDAHMPLSGRRDGCSR
jgi:imidazolonepropionase-like amidohydrolase